MDTMTENDYLIAWGLYAFAALGCLLVWMRMTRWMWRWLREPLRVLMAVLLFSPTIIDPVKEKYAPAVAITALDLAFKVGNNAFRAISELLMYAMIALGLYLVFVLIRLPIERASNARKEKAEAARAAARVEERDDDQPFGGAGDDRYGRPPVPSNPQRMRVEPRL
ncbi:MFS transporter [Pseudomonas botevensis]|uniref:MFS transporter n=1 Tax=Pseudomonas botevensis TaxID=2842352 RepID=UPI001C3E0772|nr:MFS transporter [Pseudomonas botevensis]MBV4474985.1 MFS transporter [Pseudomonas botevensis]